MKVIDDSFEGDENMEKDDMVAVAVNEITVEEMV